MWWIWWVWSQTYCVWQPHCGSPVWPDFLPPPGWVTPPSTSAHLCYQNRSPRRFPYYQSPQSLHCLNRLPQVSQKFWGKPIMRRILSQGGSPPLPPSQPKQVTHTSLITNHTKRITEQQYHNIFTRMETIFVALMFSAQKQVAVRSRSGCKHSSKSVNKNYFLDQANFHKRN